ncbi:hypothetical protein HY338_02705 [Candidatus Gottesmanbacteria bacterium]|nr:hypothetical protein [Candidatus Gottesmanbacteria bacterium]
MTQIEIQSYRFMRSAYQAQYRSDVLREVTAIPWDEVVNDAITLAGFWAEANQSRHVITQKQNPMEALRKVQENVYLWDRNEEGERFRFQTQPVLPIPLSGADVNSFRSEDERSHFSFKRKLQYAVNQLQARTPTVAIEGPRTSGKDSVIRELERRMIDKKIPTRTTKLSGFLDTPDEWQYYFLPITDEAKTVLEADRQWMEAMRRGDAKYIVKKLLKMSVARRNATKISGGQLNGLIKDSELFKDAFELAQNFVYPQEHNPGEWYWQFLQNLWMAHLNDLYQGKERGLVIANGGAVARSLFWGYYSAYPGVDIYLSEFMMHLLPAELRKLYEEQERSMSGSSFSVRLNLPDITFFLDAPDEVLVKRADLDRKRTGDAIDRRQSIKENADPLRAVMKILSDRFLDKFIPLDATKSSDQLADEIELIILERNIIK